MWKDFKQETYKIRLGECYWKDRESSNDSSLKYVIVRSTQGLVEMGHRLGLQWERGPWWEKQQSSLQRLQMKTKVWGETTQQLKAAQRIRAGASE